MRNIRRMTLQSFFCAVALSLLSGMALAESPRTFDIAAQSLSRALLEFSKQADLIVTAPTDLVQGKAAPAVRGAMEPMTALAKLLEGSGLNVVRTQSGGITVGRLASDSGTATESDEVMRLARSEAPPLAKTNADEPAPTSSKGATESRQAGIDEIIVTATKRRERLQDVPMSITAITGEDLERRSVVGMEDFLRTIPGVNLVDRGPRDNSIVIRGVSVSQESEFFSAGGTTVATYLDETPITGAAGGIGADVRPVDIERIEVLRGPQGTAYGSSSLGGALRYITVKPKLEGFSAKVAGSYSNTGGFGSDNSMIQGVVNIPLAETFALRAVGYRYDESGTFRNVVDAATLARATTAGVQSLVAGFSQDDIGATVSTGGRLTALWKPADKLDFSLTYLQQTIEQNGAPAANTGTYLQSMMPVDPRARINGEPGEGSETQLDLASAALNYDLGWAGLTSVVSWTEGKAVTALEISRALGRPASDYGLGETQSISTETRLASHLDGRVQFLGGLFYDKSDYDALELAYWPGTAIGVPVPAGVSIPGTDPFFISQRARHLEQRAVFGEVSFDLTQTLTATLGGRYFEYDRDERIIRREGSLLNIPLSATVPQLYEVKEDGTNFKGNLTYKPTQNATLYASWSEGFRLGRPDVGLAACDRNNDGIVDSTTLAVSSTQNIASDSLESMELGAKFALFDRRMTVDAAVYHIKWEGLPVRTVLPNGSAINCPTAFIANASAATSDGFELQASVAVTDNLRLDFGGSYTNAELSADAPNLTPPAFEGYRLPGSPKVSGNLSAQYEFDVAGYKAFIRGDSAYTGEYYGDFLQTPGVQAGEYIKVDARTGVAINSFSVELYVRNLTNQDDFTWRGAGVSAAAGGTLFGYRLRPRTVGLQLGYTF